MNYEVNFYKVPNIPTDIESGSIYFDTTSRTIKLGLENNKIQEFGGLISVASNHNILTFHHADSNKSLQYEFAGLALNENGEIFNDIESNKATSYSHAEGYQTSALGPYSHTEGRFTKTSVAAYNSHAEGYETEVNKPCAHAEGYKTKANGENSHVEGYETEASGINSHAEGKTTMASGDNSHAEGRNCISNGLGSHAEGLGTSAIGDGSHTEGKKTIANNLHEHAEGQFNLSNENTIHSVGIGENDRNRKNAHEITLSGQHYIYGIGGYDGTNPNQTNSVQTVINFKQDKLTDQQLSAINSGITSEKVNNICEVLYFVKSADDSTYSELNGKQNHNLVVYQNYMDFGLPSHLHIEVHDSESDNSVITTYISNVRGSNKFYCYKGDTYEELTLTENINDMNEIVGLQIEITSHTCNGLWYEF